LALHGNIYVRLVVLTIGTLLPFFWIVVILGHRRQRNFERIFFFFCLSLVFFFAGSLLAVNAQLYYATVPRPLERFAWTLVCVGLWLLPALLVHLHVEYARVRDLLHPGWTERSWLVGAYAPGLALLPSFVAALQLRRGLDFSFPSSLLGRGFELWLVAAFVVAALWQHRFFAIAPNQEQKSFHRGLTAGLLGLALALFLTQLLLWQWPSRRNAVEFYQDYLLLFAVSPLFDLLRRVQKVNFLQIGRQRNLLYAVFAAFIGLLYLSFIRRVSLWLEPYFPPEATAALLLFLPVVLFEPLQRLVGRVLQRAAQSEMDQAGRTMGPIQDTARLGDVRKLHAFAQKWIAEQLQLARVEILLDGERPAEAAPRAPEELFPMHKLGRQIGALRVKPYGAMLSGETSAALEFLCEQLPAAFDLCRLIEEKLRLERELAERERLAALGQMAASVSHNLKNPLGSIKTILQVQLESPAMPEALKSETRMVLAEISRLSNKLGQLLQFSRPAVLGEAAAGCDLTEVIAEVTGVLRHEAERKNIRLETSLDGSLRVAAAREAVNDIVSNLILNSLEAASSRGRVGVSAAERDGKAVLRVEDDGKGIPAELREKVLQPFFTTKTQGTGLGLSIVAKRVAEANGALELASPIADGRGTRFSVCLPLEREGQ
jgi:signal transduction histidine kinase